MAASYLDEAGYQVRARNYRSDRNEVDLVCEDPEEDEVVFVEVKTRTGSRFGPPEASVTDEKQASLIEVARAYLYEHDLEGSPTRFDVVGIMLSGSDPQIQHYQNAFWA